MEPAQLPVLYYPLVVAGVAFITAWLWPKKPKKSEATLEFFAFLPINLRIASPWIGRVSAILVGVLMVFYAIVRDYSVFFPGYIQYRGFFDDVGIERMLISLPTQQLERLRVAKDWRVKKAAFIDKMNDDLSRANIPFQFRTGPGLTVGYGEMFFKITKIGNWGIQRYRIVEGKGPVTYVSEMPGGLPTPLYTLSQLVDSSTGAFDASILDLLTGVLILPEFNQRYVASPTVAKSYINVIAATRVDVFPLIDISATLWLVRQADGTAFPIGYAIINTP